MNRYRKLLSNTALIGIGTVCSKLLVFFLMPFYTAWLTTAEYGAAELIAGIADFLIPIAGVGVSSSIFRFAAERESDREKVFTNSTLLLFAGLLGFLILSPILYLFKYSAPYLWLIVLYVVFADVQAVCAQYVRAIDRMPLFAGQGILNTLLTILFNILFLRVFRIGLVGYVLSVVLGNFFTVIFLALRIKLWRAFRRDKIDRKLMRELLRFGLPMIPTTVCWLITNISDRAMVTAICGESINGLYSAAYKLPTVINLMSGVFMQAWQFSAVVESSDEETCKRYYSEVYGGYLSVVFIGTAGLLLLSGVLIRIFLNSAFYGAAEYMPTLFCAVAAESVVAFLASVYLVKKKPSHSLCTALAGAVVNILLNAILIPRIGALGAAIATLSSYVLVLILRMIDVPRLIRFRLFLPRFAVSAALLLGAAAAQTFMGEGRFVCVLILTGLTVGINASALLKSVKGILTKRGSAAARSE